MRDLIKALKALSDETRIRMLKLLLGREELCVCEIMEVLEISQSRASRNLGILKDAGFLKDRRDGQWVYYSINGQALGDHSALLELLKRSLNENETILRDRENLKNAEKCGLRCPAC